MSKKDDDTSSASLEDQLVFSGVLLLASALSKQPYAKYLQTAGEAILLEAAKEHGAKTVVEKLKGSVCSHCEECVDSCPYCGAKLTQR